MDQSTGKGRRKSPTQTGRKGGEGKPNRASQDEPQKSGATLRDYGLIVAGVVLILASGVVGFRPTFEAIFYGSSPERAVFHDDLNDRGAELKRKATVTGNPGLGPYGVYTVPGQGYDITWKFELEEGETPLVRVWSPRPAQVEAFVSFRVGERQERVAVPPGAADHLLRPAQIQPASTDGQPVEVIFSVPPQSSIQGAALVLDKIAVGARGFGRGALQPNAWTLFPAMFLPLIVYACGLRFGARSVVGALLSLGASLFIATAALAWTDAFKVAAGLFLFGSVLLTGSCSSWIQREGYLKNRSRIPLSLLCRAASVFLALALLSIVLAVRWEHLLVLAGENLFPDAIHYRGLAQEMRHPLDTGPREPLHMILIWLFSTFTSWGTVSLRLYTVVLSLLEGAALYWVGRRFLGIPFAALLVLLYAFNPVLAFSAEQGLREELFPLLVLTTVGTLFRVAHAPEKIRNHALAGLAGAAVVLTRVSGLGVFPPLYLLTLWNSRARVAVTKWRAPAVAGLCFVLPVIAMLARAAVVTGDPFISSTIVTKFYHNVEFAGKPGYLTKAEFERDAFAGPPVTTGEYLFKHHTVGEVFEGTAKGLWRMFFGDVARTKLLRIGTGLGIQDGIPVAPPNKAETLLFAFYLLGILFCARTADGRLLLGAYVLMQLPLGFLAGRDLLHTRLMMNATPVMLLIGVVGVQEVLKLAGKALDYLNPDAARTRPELAPRNR